MNFVYVLISESDKKFYIGLTQDVQRRLADHNSGKVQSTQARRPFKLIYYESYLDQRDAEGREKFLKSGSGHRFIEKQLKHFLLDFRGDT